MRATLREAAAAARFRLGSAREALREAYRHARVSYSQEGEDRILFAHLGGRDHGFYVDIGAHHPYRFSNTQLFYERGWRGINVDADADAVRLFAAARPEDVNLCAGVGLEPGAETLYVFREPALNTFDQALAREREMESELVGERRVGLRPLADVLDEHLPTGREITFLNVDVEGRDLDVLRSNNWSRYRPEVVLAESLLLASLEDLVADPVYRLLRDAGYGLLGKTVNTLIFARGPS